MELLQRLQPLDFLLVILWAAIVGWGLQTGLIRQLGMLFGVYVAAIAAGSLYQPGGLAVALAFGRESQPRWEFTVYVAVFVVLFVAVGVLIGRAYPLSRLSRRFGTDNVLGGVVGALWGVLLLIMIVTVLRYYAITPWRGQETAQQGILTQVLGSQVAPVLRVVLTPLWQIMLPWLPGPVLALT